MNDELIWKTNKNGKRYCFKSKQSNEKFKINSNTGKVYKETKNNKQEINKSSVKYSEDVSYVCQIGGIKEIEKEYGELKNYDVVVTDERLKHIIERRKDDSMEVINNIKDTILNYDAIYDDSKHEQHEDPGIIYIKKANDDLNCAVIVALSTKDSSKANSVITGIMLGKSLERYLKNRKKIV